MVSQEHVGQQFTHAQVHVMGGDPARGFPHAFMPVCHHPDHHEDPAMKRDYAPESPGFWSGGVHRGNDNDSPGWHQAWDEAKAHDIRFHLSSDASIGPNYDEHDPFSPRTTKS